MSQTRIQEICEAIKPVAEDARGAAEQRQGELTKPPGSLGQLEALGIQLAAIAGTCPPPKPVHPVVTLFAGDHGICAQGVSPWPQEVTFQMAANIAAGGAAISVLAKQFGARLLVTDVGVLADTSELPGVLDRKVRPGTADLSLEPAMSRDEAIQALLIGYQTAKEALAEGDDCLIVGEMGIGNTSPAAALISVFCEVPVATVVGHGAGADDDMKTTKAAVLKRALELHGCQPSDPLGTLAAVGGLEIAAMTGAILAAAQARKPVLVDGVIASAATLTAVALAPNVAGYLVAGHAGAEPGIAATQAKLQLIPLVDLQLRLGEGSGAMLAFPLVQAAAAILAEMATFAEAGVGDGS